MKQKITITVNKEILKWIDSQIKEYKFRNRSHAFEFGIYKLIQQD